MRLGPRASGIPEAIGASDATAPAAARGAGPGWLFGAVTVVPAMLVAAWLLPGLPLLLADRFTALPMVLMFAPLAVGSCLIAK